MAKKKNFWYVLVLTETGPTFVTKINYSNKTAEWNKDESPIEFNERAAKDLALGLCANLNMAYAVCSAFKLDSQPYHYEMGKFIWKTRCFGEEEDD